MAAPSAPARVNQSPQDHLYPSAISRITHQQHNMYLAHLTEPRQVNSYCCQIKCFLLLLTWLLFHASLSLLPMRPIPTLQTNTAFILADFSLLSCQIRRVWDPGTVKDPVALPLPFFLLNTSKSKCITKHPLVARKKCTDPATTVSSAATKLCQGIRGWRRSVEFESLKPTSKLHITKSTLTSHAHSRAHRSCTRAHNNPVGGCSTDTSCCSSHNGTGESKSLNANSTTSRHYSQCHRQLSRAAHSWCKTRQCPLSTSALTAPQDTSPKSVMPITVETTATNCFRVAQSLSPACKHTINSEPSTLDSNGYQAIESLNAGTIVAVHTFAVKSKSLTSIIHCGQAGKVLNLTEE